MAPSRRFPPWPLSSLSLDPRHAPSMSLTVRHCRCANHGYHVSPYGLRNHTSASSHTSAWHPDHMNISDILRAWAKRIKRDGVTLWFAGKHPRTPWYAKVLGVFVVAYALSPIDMIPDFIPVLGYLDDVLLLPGLIWLTVKLLPADVLRDCRIKADEWMRERGTTKPSSRVGAVLVVALWLAIAVAAWFWLRSKP